ncbi:U3 snoRNP protein [Oleoguttula sp. CCFEE 5521]
MATKTLNRPAATLETWNAPQETRQTELQVRPGSDDEEEVVENDSEIEFGPGHDDEEEAKDDDEAELERLVFGDSDGFRQNLKNFSLDTEKDEGEDGADSTGLEGLDDAALFVTDLAPGEVVGPATTTDDEGQGSRHPAAWEDSDDERLVVSLATVPRLRKLRLSEADDLVNGKEYSKRLQRQFELLTPRPEWATHASQKPARKRRRLSGDISSSDEEAGYADDMDVDNEVPNTAPLAKLLQDAQTLVREPEKGAGKKRKIRPETLDIQRTKDIPGIQPSAITSLSFHSKHPLLLSSGPSSTLYLHHLASSPPAPIPNPLLTSLHIHGAPLSTTAFQPHSTRIFLSARRRFFHIWDLETGQVEKITRVYGHQHEQRSMERFKLSPDGKSMALLGSARKGGGVINILSTATLQWQSQVRLESRGGIAEFCWWRDSRGLCIAGKNGEISEWSVAEQRIVARWQDEGAVGTTTLALGGQHEFVKSPIGTDRWISIGSSSGIVNIYDRRAWLAEPSKLATVGQPTPTNPSPAKTLDHLTTPTSHLAFSHDGQMMVMASKWKRDALRMVHLPSCTVFKNWPTDKTPLGRVTGVAFCEGSVVGGDVYAALAVANEQGKIRVWEMR